MNLKTLEIAINAAIAAFDRAQHQLRGLTNDLATADLSTVRLNLIDAKNWIEANRGGLTL